jgi:hypothetical protein
MPFQKDMPYALNFPANEVGVHEKVCFIIEYAFSRYMTYMRVDCTTFVAADVVVTRKGSPLASNNRQHG